MQHPNKIIMKKAINLAYEKCKEGGHAVAAIIVKDDKIISEAFTSVRRDIDPTAHAEINAIRIAAKKLEYKLFDCYLYTTFEPCPMCTSATIWAKIKGIIYKANMSDQTESHPQRISIRASEIIEKGVPRVELFPECMRDECTKLLTFKE